MPITYEIEARRGRVVTTCAGNVTLRDVMAHFAALQRDPRRPGRLDVLLDWTELAAAPGAPQVQAAADRVALVEDLVFGACAIVAPTDVLFGVARMFEALARGQFAAIQTFRKRADAEAWLDEF
jgi:predicted NBD/HSP70 family sugar kinase